MPAEGDSSAAAGDDPDADPGEESASGGRVFVSAEARRDAALRTLGVVAGLGAVAIVLQAVAPGVTDPAWVTARLSGLGPLAPLGFVALQTVQVILAPIPGQTLAGVGGYLFGTTWGTVYSMVGVTLGSAAVFLATRRFGRPYVERVVDPSALHRWDDFVDRAGVPGLFVLFLLPTFPDDVLCFVAGLTDVRFGTFLALVVVGRTPTFVAAAYAGTRLADGALYWFAAVLAALALGSAAVYAARQRIVAALDGGG